MQSGSQPKKKAVQRHKDHLHCDFISEYFK